MKRPNVHWIIQKDAMVAGKGKAPAVKEEHEEPVHRESELLGPLRLTLKDLAQIKMLPKYTDLCIDVFFRSLCENQADGSVVFVDTMLSKVTRVARIQSVTGSSHCSRMTASTALPVFVPQARRRATASRSTRALSSSPAPSPLPP